MPRHIFTAIIAAALGFGLGVAVDRHADRTPAADPAGATAVGPVEPRSVTRVAEELPPAVAQAQRDSHYRDLHSVADTLALPGDFAETEALYALAGRADAAMLDRYVREAAALENRNDRRGALHILLSRLTELDARRALRELDALGLEDEPALLRTVFYGWSRLDLDAAMAHVPALATAERRQIATDAILDAHESAAPAVIERIAATLESSETGVSARARLLATRARQAPREALDEALRLPLGSDREQAVYWSADIWARRDPEAALAYVQRIGDQRLRTQLEMAVIHRWARDDPEAVLAMLPQVSDHQLRTRMQQVAMNRLGSENPLRGIEIAAALPAQLREQAYHAVFQGWAQRDASSAMQYVETIGNAQLRRSVAANIAYQFAEQQPHEALAWVERAAAEHAGVRQTVLSVVARSYPERAFAAALGLESPGERAQALATVVNAVAETDPRRATGYLARMEPGAQQTQAAAQIAMQWAQSEPAAALQWALGLEGSAYRQAVATIGWQLAMHDPDLAARQLPKLEEGVRSQWASAVAAGYARHDAERAVAWVGQFQGDPGYPEMVSQIAQTIAEHDPRAALGVIDRLSGEAHESMALHNVLATWASRDPEEAAAYVARISDETTRHAAASAVASQWAAVDHDAARRWALALPSGAARDEALSMIAQQRSDDPDGALSMMESIHSAEVRAHVFNSVFYQLAQHDPARARQILQRARIDPQSRQQAADWLEERLRSGQN